MSEDASAKSPLLYTMRSATTQELPVIRVKDQLVVDKPDVMLELVENTLHNGFSPLMRDTMLRVDSETAIPLEIRKKTIAQLSRTNGFLLALTHLIQLYRKGVHEVTLNDIYKGNSILHLEGFQNTEKIRKALIEDPWEFERLIGTTLIETANQSIYSASLANEMGMYNVDPTITDHSQYAVPVEIQDISNRLTRLAVTLQSHAADPAKPLNLATISPKDRPIIDTAS